MTDEHFKEMIEKPLVGNNNRMINASSHTEQEFYRSNGITLKATIARTIIYCLHYPEQAKRYYDSLPKATMD